MHSALTEQSERGNCLIVVLTAETQLVISHNSIAEAPTSSCQQDAMEMNTRPEHAPQTSEPASDCFARARPIRGKSCAAETVTRPQS